MLSRSSESSTTGLTLNWERRGLWLALSLPCITQRACPSFFHSSPEPWSSCTRTILFSSPPPITGTDPKDTTAEPPAITLVDSK
ncbi:hypothetical protein JOB18_004357 [Solea senegalensis]|uniref:Secreted protein n=1 Tax=Solea senegalensis TaxID=28829 RepID=A0AAV6QTY7_SOLSE|nr:hypothetical protein JOB18_004357 [Solea senegalensis]